jgi:hypothetical protein
MTLYEQVKRKLDITWEDEDTAARVKKIIDSAIPDLKHKLGITDDDFDFSVSGSENLLFLAYCLYEWNHALNEFDENYARMIAQVRQKHEVAKYMESEGNESEQA